MLYQELPPIKSTPLDGWARWLAPLLILGAALTAALLLLLLVGRPVFASAVGLVGLVASAFAFFRKPTATVPDEPLVVGPDYSLLGSALGLSSDPVALTTGEGSLLLVNEAYRQRFGDSRPPLELATDDQAREGLKLAQSMAWRDGAGCVATVETAAGSSQSRSSASVAKAICSFGVSSRRLLPIRSPWLRTAFEDGPVTCLDARACSQRSSTRRAG